MAEVHFSFTNAMQGITPTYGGSPSGESTSGGGSTTATLGNAQIVRAVAVTGASYVRVGKSSGAAASASNGFYLAEGQSIDLHGSPGDVAYQADA